MNLADKVARALKPDAQAFDEVRIVTVPRYKTSGLSGDEWRISAKVTILRKGKVILEQSFRNVEYACAFLPATYHKAVDDGKGLFAGEDDICDQEGCAASATVTYRLRHGYCRDGHKSDLHWPTIRKFCDEHKVRGDCGLDDADANYGPAPTELESER